MLDSGSMDVWFFCGRLSGMDDGHWTSKCRVLPWLRELRSTGSVIVGSWWRLGEGFVPTMSWTVLWL
jgi:hypothetical protein